MTSRAARGSTAPPPAPAVAASRRAAPRRAPAPAARRRRPDADRPRGRPVLEGVHLADRARQDAPDRRDDRMARAAPRGRRRASSRAASPPTSARRPRRSSPAPTRCSRSTRSTTRSASTRKALPAVLGTGSAELHVRALNGEAMARAQTGDVKGALALLARVARARRARRVLRHRPRRGAVPPGGLPVHAFEHLDRGRSLQRGARRSPSARGCRPTSCA